MGEFVFGELSKREKMVKREFTKKIEKTKRQREKGERERESLKCFKWEIWAQLNMVTATPNTSFLQKHLPADS